MGSQLHIKTQLSVLVFEVEKMGGGARVLGSFPITVCMACCFYREASTKL